MSEHSPESNDPRQQSAPKNSPNSLPQAAAETEHVSEELKSSKSLSEELSSAGSRTEENQTEVLDSQSGSSHPRWIGRYRIQSVLGSGGFGTVYVAQDDQLQRRVTLKVPHAHRLRTEQDIQFFIGEARTLAQLEHPNIVPIHDVGHDDHGLCFIVSRYIDGSDLFRRFQAELIVQVDAIELMIDISEALHYVHGKGIIHRDIKPSNILLDKAGTAYLCDFGLAVLAEKEAQSRRIMGTPSYMSPEQARGENHLVDRASDIFSLGVVLHELISGKRLFSGLSTDETLRIIEEDEVPSLRELNAETPAELDRICMKALSKRASDRHATALDFAEDLRHFLSKEDNVEELRVATGGETLTGTNELSNSSSRVVGMVPKGLRSFGKEDAHFFLDLLPGPYDRKGLPESILFWKRRVEERDVESSFRVGLIYGPSGCGKSSFIKAGLLPVLDGDVQSVFVEAAPETTEKRLLHRLRRISPNLDPQLSLPDSIAAYRHQPILGKGKKLLIVIDQFEQWLYSVENPERSELAKALRQCDGEHVQCILLVRDDYWLAFSRFMNQLEVELRQNRNMMLVDLFSHSHARSVLIEFGRAYGKLPVRSKDFGREHRAFLAEAISELSEDGKVTPVRLALLAEVIKHRDWTVSALRKMGGSAGIGVTFLEENFISANAPADYRVHQRAAFEVLRELLPQPGTDLKGHMRSYEELLVASGYADRPQEFQSLLRAMDNELHVISRTHPEGRGEDLSRSLSGNQSAASGSSDSQSGRPERSSAKSSSSSIVSKVYYQLAHDYLVPAIRQLQSRLQKATRQGRAEIRLNERAEVWQARPESRHLPTWTEWFSIVAFSQKSRWTSAQQRMMRKATARYTKVTLLATLLLVLCAGGVWQLLRWSKSQSLTQQLATAGASEVPELLDQFEGRETWAVSQLQKALEKTEPGSQSHLFLSLALLRFGESDLLGLHEAIFSADAATLNILRTELKPYASELTRPLWEKLADESVENATNKQGRSYSPRLNSALLLASYDVPSERAAPHSAYLADQLIHFANSERQHYATLVELAQPLSPVVVEELNQLMVDDSETELRRSTAQTLLKDLLRDRPSELCDRFLLASTEQISSILPIIKSEGGNLPREVLRNAQQASYDLDDPNWEVKARRQAMAAALLLRDGAASDDLWQLFVLGRIPDATTQLIQCVRPLGVSGDLIAQRLLVEEDDRLRCGLMQALGQFDIEELKEDNFDQAKLLVKTWLKLGKTAELRSNALWLMRTWGEDEWIASVLHLPQEDDATRNWYVNAQGQTLVRLPRHGEANYRIDASIGEVTLREMQAYRPDLRLDNGYVPTLDCPCTHQSYNAVALYCNWLTIAEGLGESQLCYDVPTDVGETELINSETAIDLVDDYRERSGYRLPTAEEWFFMYRGGVDTNFSFGHRQALADGYGCFINHNGGMYGLPLGYAKPNPYGLFKLLASTREWVSEVDPKPTMTHRRGLCGLSWRGTKASLTLLPIGYGVPNLKYSFHGFRVVRSRPLEQE